VKLMTSRSDVAFLKVKDRNVEISKGQAVSLFLKNLCEGCFFSG